MGWFETHAHLADAQFDPDRAAVIDRAIQAGVDRLIEIADGPVEWTKARTLAEQYPERMWWAAGLHPYYADQISEAVLSDLKLLKQHPRFVAIGEIGLDYARCPVSADVQKKTFRQILSLSQELELPLILHCRDAYPDFIEILEYTFGHRPSSHPSPGVVHCFSSHAEHAQTLVAMGFYLGVDAPITYPKAHSLREALAAVSVDRLVIETDSPYLPPQPFRGHRNEPSYIPIIGERLAEIKKISIEDLMTTLWQNSCTLFRVK